MDLSLPNSDGTGKSVNHATISGMNCTVRGHHNNVSGMNAKVFGDDNVVSGMNATVKGNRNTVSGAKWRSTRGGNGQMSQL